jgi:predicted enzyme related to lactoylglutathione lyase
MQATISHFEIPARDIERAASFYRQVFGWRIEPRPWAGGGYCVVRAAASGRREGIDGGLLEMAAPSSPAGTGGTDAGAAPAGRLDHPLLVIHLHGEPLEACLARVLAGGGAVDLPVIGVGKTGRFARFRDPEQNLLGLWQETGWEVD